MQQTLPLLCIFSSRYFAPKTNRVFSEWLGPMNWSTQRRLCISRLILSDHRSLPFNLIWNGIFFYSAWSVWLARPPDVAFFIANAAAGAAAADSPGAEKPLPNTVYMIYWPRDFESPLFISRINHLICPVTHPHTHHLLCVQVISFYLHSTCSAIP